MGTPIERIDGSIRGESASVTLRGPPEMMMPLIPESCRSFGIDRKDVALNTCLADTASKQVTVLTARVENCDSVHGEIITS